MNYTLEDVIEILENELGTSNENIDGPSYILPDGSFLNIWNSKVPLKGMSGCDSKSGKAMHLDVDGYIRYILNIDCESFWLNQICIRVNNGFEEYVVLPKTRPNETQFQSLDKWLDTYFFKKNHKKVTVMDWYGSYINNKDYSIDTYFEDDIIKKIKRYYATGELVESSSDDKIYYVSKEEKEFNKSYLDDYHYEVIDLKDIIDKEDLINKAQNHPKDWGKDTTQYKIDSIKQQDWMYSPVRYSHRGGLIDGKHRLIALHNNGYNKAEILVRNESLKEDDSVLDYLNFDKVIKKIDEWGALTNDVNGSVLILFEDGEIAQCEEVGYDFHAGLMGDVVYSLYQEDHPDEDMDNVEILDDDILEDAYDLLGIITLNDGKFLDDRCKVVMESMPTDSQYEQLTKWFDKIQNESREVIVYCRQLQHTYDFKDLISKGESPTDYIIKSIKDSFRSNVLESLDFEYREDLDQDDLDIEDIDRASLNESLKENNKEPWDAPWYRAYKVKYGVFSTDGRYGTNNFTWATSDPDYLDFVEEDEKVAKLKLKPCKLLFYNQTQEEWDALVNKYGHIEESEIFDTINPSEFELKLLNDEGFDGFLDGTVLFVKKEFLEVIDDNIDLLNEDLNTSKHKAITWGDLDYAKKTDTRGISMVGRGTGHFGTGFYFVGASGPYGLNGERFYDYAPSRPIYEIDLEPYNLFKPKDNDTAYQIHDAMRDINNGYGSDFIPWLFKNTWDEEKIEDELFNIGWDAQKVYEDFDDNLDDLDYDLSDDELKDLEKEINPKSEEELDKEYEEECRKGYKAFIEKYQLQDYVGGYNGLDDWLSTSKLGKIEDDIKNAIHRKGRDMAYIEWAIKLLAKIFNKSTSEMLSIIDKCYNDKESIDTISTQIFKAMGYEGVDVTHLNHDAQGLSGLDNFSYGTVIYDLKPGTFRRIKEPRDVNNPKKKGFHESLDSVENKIIDKLESMGYTKFLVSQGWKDEQGNDIEDNEWEYREEPEEDWFYVQKDYYRFSNDENQVSLSIKIDEKNKEFTIIGIYGNYEHSTKGFATKTLDACLQLIPTNWKVNIENNINREYWNHIRSKYPQYNFVDTYESLKESKQDIERFRQWAGDELADRFFKQKAKIKAPWNDITYIMKHYGSREDFEKDIKWYEDNPSRKEAEVKGKQGAEKIYEDDNWLVLDIQTYEASVLYGKHTSWCVTGNNSYDGKTDFDIHTNTSKLIFYIPKKGSPAYWHGKYALEFAGMHNWTLFNDADFVEVGEGEYYKSAMGDVWSAQDCGGKHPNFPKIEGLPDINKAYQDLANEQGYEKPLILENKNDYNSIITREFSNINKFLEPYGFEAQYIEDYEFDNDSVGMFLNSEQDNASIFPIALNIDSIKENGEDLFLDIKSTIAHEVGHGIFQYLNDIYELDDLDEEDVVEEFGRDYCDNMLDYNKLYNLLQQYIKEN